MLPSRWALQGLQCTSMTSHKDTRVYLTPEPHSQVAELAYISTASTMDGRWSEGAARWSEGASPWSTMCFSVALVYLRAVT